PSPPAPAADPAPPVTPADEVERRLASHDAPTSMRAAIGAILAAWHARPLAADEPVDLAQVAARRGLEDLPLVGNGRMLRFLDLDRRVGRLTRIVLYTAVGGYPRPALGASS